MRSSKNKVNNKWNRLLLCIPAIISLLLIYIFFNDKDAFQKEPYQESETWEILFPITTADNGISADDAENINLNDVSDQVIIEHGGTYLLEGSLNGRIVVQAEEQIVHLILNGVSVYSRSGPAISILSAGKVILTLPDETENTLRDSADYENLADENACIYSECDLTINGSGTMNVHGYYKDAIHSKDTLKILDSHLNILAKREAIRGNDGILLKDSHIHIECEKNGLYTKNTGRKNRGCVQISGGKISIVAGEYAIAAVSDLYINDAEVYLKGIISDLDIAGNSYIQKGCLQDE